MALLAKKLGLSDETVDLDDVVLWFHCQAKKRAVKKFNSTLEGIRTSFKGIIRCLHTLKLLNYDQSMANNVKECVPKCIERLIKISEEQNTKIHLNCLTSIKNYLNNYYHIDTEVKLKHRELGRDYQKLLRNNEFPDPAEIHAKKAFDKIHLELKTCIRKFLYGQDSWQTLVSMLKEWKTQWSNSDTELLDLAQKLSQAERLDRPKPPTKDPTCAYCINLPAWERRFSGIPRPSSINNNDNNNGVGGEEEQIDVEGLQDNEFDPEFDQFDALVMPLMLEVRAMRDTFKQIPIHLKNFVSVQNESLRSDLETIKQREDIGCEEMEMLPRPKNTQQQTDPTTMTALTQEDGSEFFSSVSGGRPSLLLNDFSRRPTLSSPYPYFTPRGSSSNNNTNNEEQDLSCLDFPEISRTAEDLQMNLNAANLIEFYEEIEQKAGRFVMRKLPKEEALALGENQFPSSSSSSSCSSCSSSSACYSSTSSLSPTEPPSPSLPPLIPATPFSGITFVVTDAGPVKSKEPPPPPPKPGSSGSSSNSISSSIGDSTSHSASSSSSCNGNSDNGNHSSCSSNINNNSTSFRGVGSNSDDNNASNSKQTPCSLSVRTDLPFMNEERSYATTPVENELFSPLPHSDSLPFWPPYRLTASASSASSSSFLSENNNSSPFPVLFFPRDSLNKDKSNGNNYYNNNHQRNSSNQEGSGGGVRRSLSHSFSDSALDQLEGGGGGGGAENGGYPLKHQRSRGRRRKSTDAGRPRSGSSPVKNSSGLHRENLGHTTRRTLSSSSLPLFTGKVCNLDFLDTYLQSLASSVSLLDDNDTSFVSELDEILQSLDVMCELFEKGKRLKLQFQQTRKQFEIKHLKETQEQEKARRELVQKNERLRLLLLEKTKRSYLKELDALKKLRTKRKSDAGRRLSAQYRKTEEVRAQAQFKRIQRMEQLAIEIKKLTAEGSEANGDEPVDFNEQQLYALGPEIKDDDNGLDESFPKPIYSSSHAQLRQKVLELHQATSHVIHHMNYMLQLAPREIHRALIGLSVRLQTTISNMATATKLAYNQAQEFTKRRQTRANAALYVLLRGIGAESGELGDWEISSESDDNSDDNSDQDADENNGEMKTDKRVMMNEAFIPDETVMKHSVPVCTNRRRPTRRTMMKSPLKTKLSSYRLEKRTGVATDNLVDVYCGFQPIRLLPHIARLERVLYGDAKAVHVRVVVNWDAGPLVYELDIVGLRRVRFVVSLLRPRQLDIRSGGPDVERFIPVGKLCTNKVSKEQFREFAEQYLVEHANYKLFSENCRTYSDVLMLKAVTDQAVWGKCAPISPLAFIHEQSKSLYSWIKKKRIGSSAHAADEKKEKS